MSIAQTLLAEFEQEALLTRPFLERLQAEHLTWKPHEKSMTAGQLAFHIAAVPGGIIQMAAQDQAAPPSIGMAAQPATTAELLTAFDASVAKVREVLPTLDDASMARAWSLIIGGKTVLIVPRAAMLRNILFSHWIQHRGQFGVYLRMLDVPVPSTYGPSADEAPDFLKPAA